MIKMTVLSFCALMSILSLSRAEEAVQHPQTVVSRQLLGVSLPTQSQIKETGDQVVLNGAAARQLWGSDAYIGALYLEKTQHNPNMILLTDAPAVIEYHFLIDDITPDKIRQIWLQSIIVNNPELKANMVDFERFKALFNLFKKSINAGDVLKVQYVPKNQTVILLFNNQEVHRWTQAKTFFNRILKTWIGQFPPSRQFKQGILGE